MSDATLTDLLLDNKFLPLSQLKQNDLLELSSVVDVVVATPARAKKMQKKMCMMMKGRLVLLAVVVEVEEVRFVEGMIDCHLKLTKF